MAEMTEHFIGIKLTLREGSNTDWVKQSVGEQLEDDELIEFVDTSIDLAQARIILELLYNSGWIDDADELIDDNIRHYGLDVARTKQAEINKLIGIVNSLVPEEEQVSLINEV